MERIINSTKTTGTQKAPTGTEGITNYERYKYKLYMHINKVSRYTK